MCISKKLNDLYLVYKRYILKLGLTQYNVKFNDMIPSKKAIQTIFILQETI